MLLFSGIKSVTPKLYIVLHFEHTWCCIEPKCSLCDETNVCQVAKPSSSRQLLCEASKDALIYTIHAPVIVHATYMYMYTL